MLANFPSLYSKELMYKSATPMKPVAVCCLVHKNKILKLCYAGKP